jgi:hypothetical protein
VVLVYLHVVGIHVCPYSEVVFNFARSLIYGEQNYQQNIYNRNVNLALAKATKMEVK